MTASLRSIDPQSIKDQASLQAVPLSSRFPLHLVSPQGQLQIHTASYRGSFSIVLSEALRTAGLGSNVLIAQFLKGGVNQGANREVDLCGRLKWIRPDIPICLVNNKIESSLDKEYNLEQAIGDVWCFCKAKLKSRTIDRLVLDEIGLATTFGLIEESDLISTLASRPAETDVILTGPSIPSEIIAMADQVTELR